jgi:hypothetical protein
MAEQDNTQVEAADTARLRVNYNADAATQMLTVSYDKEAVELPAGEELFDKYPEVKDHLALVGLTTFLQRESSRVKDADKLDAIEKAYARVLNSGAKAFERRPGGGPRGPRKADKIAALAALKGVTTAAIEKALSELSKEDQDKALNQKKVLAKLEKMQGNGDPVDLSL